METKSETENFGKTIIPPCEAYCLIVAWMDPGNRCPQYQEPKAAVWRRYRDKEALDQAREKEETAIKELFSNNRNRYIRTYAAGWKEVAASDGLKVWHERVKGEYLDTWEPSLTKDCKS